MPYDHTNLAPDFAKVLETGDPKHCCRPPRRSRRNRHIHTYLPGPGDKALLTRFNRVHGSEDTYYRVLVPRRCNVTVRPANDPEIQWLYDDSARQCARAYVAKPASPATTNMVKVSRRKGRITATAVHPTCWDHIIDPDKREIPGDVVALLSLLSPDERTEEIGVLRNGGMITCYFLS